MNEPTTKFFLGALIVALGVLVGMFLFQNIHWALPSPPYLIKIWR